MSDIVDRPSAGDKKVHSKNQFELCYLRHQYIRKAKTNPTQSEMAPYSSIIRSLSRNTYSIYRNLFGMVSFNLEDVESISQVHLVSFLGLFSMEKLPEKYEDFVSKFKDRHDTDDTPSEKDVLEKNKANFTLFLKQRLEDLVRVCRQKARNIKGFPAEEFHVFYGQNKPPKILRNLLENNEKFGFRKLEMPVFKSIKKKIKSESNIFKYSGNWYVAVPLEQKGLSLLDFSGADLNPHDNIHNMTPEEILFGIENEESLKSQKISFSKTPKSEKIEIMKSFIEKNNNKIEFSDEIKAAKKFLREIGAEVG